MAEYSSDTPNGRMASNGSSLLMVVPAATAMASSTTPAASRPDYHRPEYDAAQPALQTCRDLMEGTAAIQNAGPTYLPKHSKESLAAYEVRRTIAEVFRAFQRTVQAAVGMITATPPALVGSADDTTGDAPASTTKKPNTPAKPKDPPTVIASDWEDIDMQGTHGEVFAKHVLEDGIVSGIMAILVDTPPRPVEFALTDRDVIDLNLRPYWVHIPRDRILSWIVEPPDWKLVIGAYKSGQITVEQAKTSARRLVTRQVVIWEPTDIPASAYGVTCVDRYRVLTLTDTGVTFSVLEKRRNDKGEDIFIEVDRGQMTGNKNTPFREIPLAIGYAGRKRAPFVADPPLMALAELNIGHYRVSANRRYLMELCHAPTLVLVGVDEYEGQDEHGQSVRRQVNVGPNSVIFVPLQGDVKYAAAAPTALDSSQAEKDDLLKQMAALGMSFLAKDRAGQQETALGRKLDDAAENATHATAARALEDVLEQAVKFHSQYRGVAAPSVTVPTTYAADVADPQTANVLWLAVAADRLPIEAFLEYVKTGQLPDDIDLDLVNEIRLAKQTIAAQQTADQLAIAKHAATANPGNTSPDPKPGDPPVGEKKPIPAAA